jgi:hypothetical protein
MSSEAPVSRFQLTRLALRLGGLLLVGLSIPSVLAWIGESLLAFPIHFRSPMNAGGEFGLIGRVLHTIESWVESVTGADVWYWLLGDGVYTLGAVAGVLAILGRPKGRFAAAAVALVRRAS